MLIDILHPLFRYPVYSGIAINPQGLITCWSISGARLQNALDIDSFIPVLGDIPLSYPITPFYPTIQVGGDIVTFFYIIQISQYSLNRFITENV